MMSSVVSFSGKPGSSGSHNHEMGHTQGEDLAGSHSSGRRIRRNKRNARQQGIEVHPDQDESYVGNVSNIDDLVKYINKDINAKTLKKIRGTLSKRKERNRTKTSESSGPGGNTDASDTHWTSSQSEHSSAKQTILKEPVGSLHDQDREEMTSMAGAGDNDECPVCHEPYTLPKILPCYHIACRDCLCSWLASGGQGGGGCPLCRAPILPPNPPQGDLDALVDSLPTDLLTLSRVEADRVLSGSHVCDICPGHVAARAYCFQCAVKLCGTCSTQHKKIPATRDHDLRDLAGLTPRDFSAGYRSSCHAHPGKAAEAFCTCHQELLCWHCAGTGHRGCAAGVKVVADVAKEKRGELTQRVQGWRAQEAALSRQIQSRKDSFNQQRSQVQKVFDDLQQHVEKRRQELYDVIKDQEDGDADLEKVRAALTSHTVTMEAVLGSSIDGVVLQMMKELAPYSDVMDTKCRQAESVKAVEELDLHPQRIADIKSALSSLGKRRAGVQMATPTTLQATPVTPSQPPPPSTPTAPPTPTTTPTLTAGFSEACSSDGQANVPRTLSGKGQRVAAGSWARLREIASVYDASSGSETVTAFPSEPATTLDQNTSDRFWMLPVMFVFWLLIEHAYFLR